jgi:hypothetical protein
MACLRFDNRRRLQKRSTQAHISWLRQISPKLTRREHIVECASSLQHGCSEQNGKHCSARGESDRRMKKINIICLKKLIDENKYSQYES